VAVLCEVEDDLLPSAHSVHAFEHVRWGRGHPSIDVRPDDMASVEQEQTLSSKSAKPQRTGGPRSIEAYENTTDDRGAR
jgi:hypothetical protein